MAARFFQLRYDELPTVLPVFPLSGVLLLPEGRLPLNIFEPRYLAMVEDALAARRLIGVIQPNEATVAAANAPGDVRPGAAPVVEPTRGRALRRLAMHVAIVRSWRALLG